MYLVSFQLDQFCSKNPWAAQIRLNVPKYVSIVVPGEKILNERADRAMLCAFRALSTLPAIWYAPEEFFIPFSIAFTLSAIGGAYLEKNEPLRLSVQDLWSKQFESTAILKDMPRRALKCVEATAGVLNILGGLYLPGVTAVVNGLCFGTHGLDIGRQLIPFKWPDSLLEPLLEEDDGELKEMV